ncbi:MAG: hypothetical protein C0401_03105 [Anaerolinea sp.]|nr:hypothetical protein [Anaerolinea sp.]
MSSLRQKILTLWKEDHLLRRVLQNTGYLFTSSTISMLFIAVQSILVARLLGAEALGLITIVMAFVTNVNQLFSFRMGEFVIRYFGKAMTEENIPHAGAVIKASALIEGFTSVFAFGFLFLVAPLGAKYLVKDIQSLFLFQIFGIAILANLTTETANGVLRVLNRFKTQALITLIQSILTFTMITLAFIFQGDALTILWAYLIGKIFLGVCPILVAIVTLNRELGREWWRSRISILPSIKEMAHFAISTNLSGTIKLLVSESEPLWVGFFLDTKAVGLYKNALAIVNLLMVPITPFIGTTFPEITRSVVAKKWQQLRQLLRRVTVISAIWTIFFALVMAFFGKWIIGLTYGEGFVPAYPVLMILMIGFGISNIFFWNRTLLLSFGKANIPLYVLFGAAILKIILAFYFVPRYGINAEAALLSGNFILSVGILAAVGLWTVRKSERTDSERVTA